MFENLNFRDWPFKTVADEKFASVWAGRPKTKEHIDRLLKTTLMVPRSGLHIMWANFGMGKTHTLYHVRNLCLKNIESPAIIPIYAVMPKRSTGFLELYREIVQGFPYEFLRKQLQKIGSNNNGGVALHPMFRRSPGVVKALLSLNSESIEDNTRAMQWLAAQQGLSQRDLLKIDVTYKIKTPEDAINALSALVNLACYNPDPHKENRLMILIDEYQRVGELNQRIARENNSSLHTFFNNHPATLQLVLSFSFGRRENLNILLSEELRSRANPLPIYLDVFDENEAIIFIRDLFHQFRINKDDRWAFPFEPQTISLIIRFMESKRPLTPRRLMLVFGHVLEQYMLDNDTICEEISFSSVQKYLEDPQMGSIDSDSASE